MPRKQSSLVSLHPEMLALCVNTALGKWCVLCSSKDLQGRGRGKKRDKKVYAMLLKRLLHTSFTHSRLNIHHKTCALLLLVNNRSYILKKLPVQTSIVTFRNQPNKVLSTGIASVPRHVLLPRKSPRVVMKRPPSNCQLQGGTGAGIERFLTLGL